MTTDLVKYEVGYGKPPIATRFKKGKSGNPRGRRKGSKNKIPALNEERLKSIVICEAYRTVKVNDGNKRVTMSMAEAIIRSVSVMAAKGHTRSQRLFLEMLTETEDSYKKLYDEYFQTMMHYKYLWEEEIERCQKMGITPPEPLPHPDDIIINYRTGIITIKGPMCKEDKVKWDKYRERKISCLESIRENEKFLRDNPDCSYKEFVLREISYERKLLDTIRKFIPD
jgi:hypothetical protein